MSKYLLDADVLLRSKNFDYAMDYFPGFWTWLEEKNTQNCIYSIAAVADEITGREDDVAMWVKRRGSQFFLPHATDKPMLSQLPSISTWATGQDYTPAAISEFFAAADYYLVAYALANDFTVVSNERHAEGAKKKIKIPTACLALGVPCITLFQLLRTEGAKFMMATTTPCNCNGHSVDQSGSPPKPAQLPKSK